MRTTIALATFLVAGAGALGASALDLKGSDTLEGITRELLTTAAWDCGGTLNTPAGTLVYIGSGSSNGETAIVTGLQQVAPMSRFLNPAAPSVPIGTGQVCGLPEVPGPVPDGGQSESTSEGIAFARDGLSIVVSQATGGTDACNGLEGSPCAPQQNKGMAFDNVITVPGYVCPTVTDTNPFKPADGGCVAGQYRILDSKDALRLIYFGLDHDFKSGAQRNCGNPSGSGYLTNPGLVRAALLENWSSMFKDPANCTGCTRLHRAFRRNDESGTTDAFIALEARSATCRDDVAPTAPCSAQNQVLTVNVPSINQGNRISPFCNSRQSTGVQCGPGEQGGYDNVTNPTNLPHRQGLQPVNQRTGDYDVPMPPTAPGGPAGLADINPKGNVAGGGAAQWDFPDAEFGLIGSDPYFTDFQDFDCIRRQCALPIGPGAQEQVCSARGDMGVVIPIFDPPAPTATVNPFPDTVCAQGVFIAVSAPPCQTPGPGTGRPSLCPNGAKPFGFNCISPVPAAINPGTCLGPATAAPALDPRCRNTMTNVPTGQSRNIDGRVYNLHLHENNLPAIPDHPYATVTRQAASATPGLIQAKAVGAFWRIHQSLNIATTQANNQFIIRNSGGDNILNGTTQGGAVAGQVCNATTLAPGAVSATRIIGCLVGSANRCAIGFAGGEAAQLPGADALRLTGFGPDTSCIQNGTYPLSRKLYLNTVKGFENVSGDELKLSKCFAVRTAGVIGVYPGIDTVAVNHGFVPLNTNPAGGTSCEDFDEVGKCGASTATNACTNNVAPIPTATLP